ncbi:3-deoxy-7-phosphoheptulonate synthase [Candidatus Woesearchaeota archaeon]|nr:3-deoxy-7-phosphoheptulonate synthase [Candidatus Woesearchaeota archaeon]
MKGLDGTRSLDEFVTIEEIEKHSRITGSTKIITPLEAFSEVPTTRRAWNNVLESRKQLVDILTGKDRRILIESGPCSVHSVKGALGYAVWLKSLADEFQDQFLITMRVYLEKPRTCEGWPGLLTDPRMDSSCDMNEGRLMGREVFLGVNHVGLGVTTEFLNTLTPQYLFDLTTHGVIGARSVTYQEIRKMSSGLSMPVGLKNDLEGKPHTAIDAAVVASRPQQFGGMDVEGALCCLQTSGNKDAHIILRGGNKNTNYGAGSVRYVVSRLKERGLPGIVEIDCSHANSGKDHLEQEKVFDRVAAQILRVRGHGAIRGMMIESYTKPGAQKMDYPCTMTLDEDQSVTDKCMGQETTYRCVRDFGNALRDKKKHRAYSVR